MLVRPSSHQALSVSFQMCLYRILAFFHITCSSCLLSVSTQGLKDWAGISSRLEWPLTVVQCLEQRLDPRGCVGCVNPAVITQELYKHTFTRLWLVFHKAPAQVLPVFHHSSLYPARTGSQALPGMLLYLLLLLPPLLTLLSAISLKFKFWVNETEQSLFSLAAQLAKMTVPTLPGTEIDACVL